MGQQSWRSTKRGGNLSRRLFRAAATVLLLVLVAAWLLLLRSPFREPRTHFVWLAASGPALAADASSEYLHEDFAAFEAMTQALARRRAAREVVSLQHLQSPAEMQRLAADIRNVCANPADALVLCLGTCGNSDGDRPYLRCGNFDWANPENGRYPLRSFLDDVRGCAATVKLLIIDLDRPDYEPGLGVIANRFPGLLRDEVERTGDTTLWVLTAAGDFERSHVSRALERSVFSYFVTRGLEGAADLDHDQRVTVGELYQYVAAGTGSLVRAATQDQASQTPQLLWGGGTPSPTVADPAITRVRRTVPESETEHLAEAVTEAGRTARARVFAPVAQRLAAERKKPAREPSAAADAAKPPDGKKEEPPAKGPTPAGDAASTTGAKDEKSAPAPENGDAEEPPSEHALRTAELLTEAWRQRDALAARASGVAVAERSPPPAGSRPAGRLPGAAARPQPRPWPPDQLAPHLWRELEARLLGHERRLRAGPIPDEKAFADELEDLVVALRDFAEGRTVAGHRGGAVVERLAQQRRPSWPAPDAAPSLGLAEELARRNDRPLPAAWQARAAALDGFLTGGDVNAFREWVAKSVPAECDRYTELRFARQLAADGAADWPILQLALQACRRGEQAAAAALDQPAWVGLRLEAADRRRLAAERLLADRIGADWPQRVRQGFSAALESYQAVLADLATVTAAEQLAHDMGSRCVHYARWRNAAARPGAAAEAADKALDQLLDDLIETWALLEQPAPDRVLRLERLRRQLLSSRQQLEAELQSDAVDLLLESGPGVRPIDSLLATPLLDSAARVRLLAAAGGAEARLLARTKFSEPLDVSFSPRLPTGPDWQRVLGQARWEWKIARLAAFVSGPEGAGDDPAFRQARELSQAYERLKETVTANRDDAASSALAEFSAALQAFYRVLPQRLQTLSGIAGQLGEREPRPSRLIALRAGLRALRFVAPGYARPLQKLQLADAIAAAAWYDGLLWQRQRCLAACRDASADETRVWVDVARVYRELAAAVPGQPPVPEEPPALVTLSGPSAISLADAPQAAVACTLANLSADPADVWITLDYDAQVLEIDVPGGTVVYPQETLAGEYPYRPDLLGRPRSLELAGRESTPLALRVQRKTLASTPTRIVVKALAVARDGSGVSQVRHSVAAGVPSRGLYELQVAGRPGTCSESNGQWVLYPFPNRSTDYEFRLVNLGPDTRAVDIQWLTADHLRDVRLPPGDVSAAEAQRLLEALAPVTVVVPSFEAKLPSRIPVALALPKDEKEGAKTAKPEAAAKPAPAAKPPPPDGKPGGMEAKPDATPAGTAIPARLVLVVTDRANGRRSFHSVAVLPQRPRRFLRPQVGYNPARERIEVRIAALDASLLPTGSVRVHGELLGESPSGWDVKLDAEIDARTPESQLSVSMPAGRSRTVTLAFHVDGYPRAFVYDVPCWGQLADVPESKNLTRVRITALPKGRLYRSPAGPIPVSLQVDAPVGAFENGEDAVRVGIDENRDRELAGEPAVMLYTDRQARLSWQPGVAPGVVSIATAVSDFELTLPPPRLRNMRANILAELTVSGRSVWSAPEEVVVDGAPPRLSQPRLKPGSDVPQGTELELSVLASDEQLSGVAQVEVAFDLKGTGQFADDTKPVLAKPAADSGVWSAKLATTEIAPRAYRLLMRATDQVGNVSDCSEVLVRIVAPPVAAPTVAPPLTGKVTYDKQPLAGVQVTLTPATPAKPSSGAADKPPAVTTDAQGAFQFPLPAPGKYKLQARILLHNKYRKAEADLEVLPPPARPKPQQLELR